MPDSNTDTGSTRTLYHQTIIPRGPKIQNFDGSTRVNQFISDFESLALAFDWDDKSKVNHVPMYLEGAAKKWYTQEVRPHLATIEWTALVSEMRNFFLPSDYMTCLREELRNRRQRRSESVSSYIVDIRDLCANVNPDMTEKEVLDFLFAGLLPHLKSKMSEWEPDTIKKFIECAKKAERSQGISNDHSSSNSDVTATQVQLEQLTDLVKTLQLDLQRNKQQSDESSFLTRTGSIRERTVDNRPICWRCNRPGHHQSNCRVNRSFRSYPSQYQQDSQSYDHPPNLVPTNQPPFYNQYRPQINQPVFYNQYRPPSYQPTPYHYQRQQPPNMYQSAHFEASFQPTNQSQRESYPQPALPAPPRNHHAQSNNYRVPNRAPSNNRPRSPTNHLISEDESVPRRHVFVRLVSVCAPSCDDRHWVSSVHHVKI